MQSWAYHTGKLDADGNPLDYDGEGADAKDKYWQKYMTEESPYRAKYSPPIKIKSPQRPQSGNPFPKFLGKKKKPKWMTNEQYERHAKRNVKQRRLFRKWWRSAALARKYPTTGIFTISEAQVWQSNFSRWRGTDGI